MIGYTLSTTVATLTRHTRASILNNEKRGNGEIDIQSVLRKKQNIRFVISL